MEKLNDSFFNEPIEKTSEKLLIEQAERYSKMVSLSWKDYAFPIHTYLPVPEKNTPLNMKYIYNHQYFDTKRYLFLNMLNKNHKRHWRKEDIDFLKKTENKYFNFTSLFGLLGLTSLSFSFIKKINYRIAFFYFGIDMLVNRQLYAFFIINNENYVKKYRDFQNRLLEKDAYLQKMLGNDEIISDDLLLSDDDIFIVENDLVDETLIEDWKCYLYFYKIY